jgi:hypothetical protein
MPRQRGGQALEFAAGDQHLLTAERADDPLTDASPLALVLDEIEVGVASRCLLPDEHRIVVRRFDDKLKQIPCLS